MNQPITSLAMRFGCGSSMVGILMLIACDMQSSPKGAFMRSVHAALMTYAHDHDGVLPVSDKSPIDALQKLYPDYIPMGRELAGLSGDIDGVEQSLKLGEPLTEKLSSWVYVSGLKNSDDPQLAVLWESRAGYFANGRRNPSGGRAVILLGGDITNVPVASWEGFLKKHAPSVVGREAGEVKQDAVNR